MDYLSKVAELHDDWLRMVNSFGATPYAEDIVQEMYLRIAKYDTMRLKENGDVDTSYIWVVLKNLHTDYYKQRNKIDKVGIGDNFEIMQDIVDSGFEEANEELTYRINKEIKSWCHYDQKLFNLYMSSDLSMRDIAEETTISVSSIFNTIKNCKERLRAAVGEDYMDLCNGDYDKI